MTDASDSDRGNMAVRQLIYRSSSDANSASDLASILAQSRINNGIEGLSGILLTQADRYLQVLEGSSEAVAHVFGRIAVDPRHSAVRVVADRVVARRSFGGWGMAALQEDDEEQLRFRVDRFLADAPDDVRQAFAEHLS